MVPIMAGRRGFFGFSSSLALSTACELALAPPAGGDNSLDLLARVFFLVVAFLVAAFFLAVVFVAASVLGLGWVLVVESDVVACVTSGFLACLVAELALLDLVAVEGSALRLLEVAALALAFGAAFAFTGASADAFCVLALGLALAIVLALALASLLALAGALPWALPCVGALGSALALVFTLALAFAVGVLAFALALLFAFAAMLFSPSFACRRFLPPVIGLQPDLPKLCSVWLQMGAKTGHSTLPTRLVDQKLRGVEPTEKRARKLTEAFIVD